jgi:hypothetical protein
VPSKKNAKSQVGHLAKQPFKHGPKANIKVYSKHLSNIEGNMEPGEWRQLGLLLGKGRGGTRDVAEFVRNHNEKMRESKSEKKEGAQ